MRERRSRYSWSALRLTPSASSSLREPALKAEISSSFFFLWVTFAICERTFLSLSLIATYSVSSSWMNLPFASRILSSSWSISKAVFPSSWTFPCIVSQEPMLRILRFMESNVIGGLSTLNLTSCGQAMSQIFLFSRKTSMNSRTCSVLRIQVSEFSW